MTTTPPLATAAIADAWIRLGIPPQVASFGIVPLTPGPPVTGPALPVTHLGSVDVFLEVIDGADAGSILVIDNGGRRDEACLGDLIALEAQRAGIAAIVAWGCHRDSAQLARIGLPVFSLGACALGPTRIPPAAPAMRSATITGITVHPGDIVVADDDGVAFVPADDFERVAAVAASITEVEQRQAEAMAAGHSLRDQIDFRSYLQRRAEDPAYSLREHLQSTGGAIEP